MSEIAVVGAGIAGLSAAWDLQRAGHKVTVWESSDLPGGRMADRARGTRGLAALRAVLHEALPLDADSRLEWRIWLAFWGRAVHDSALAAEQRRRYVEWRALLRGLLRDAQRQAELPRDLDPAREADALVAFVDGIGLAATLEPARMPAARQVGAIEQYLGRMGRRTKD